MRRFPKVLVYAGATLCAASALAAAPDELDEQATPAAVDYRGTFSTGLSDEAVMLLAGTALIGAAAAVRRAP